MNAFKNLVKSFGYAFRGVLLCIKSCRNFRIHMVATAYVLYFSGYYDFSSVEYAVLFLTFGSVLIAEAFNSAIEYACDSVSEQYCDKIKYSKDTAAAAVLISAIFSLCVAGALFFDRDVIMRIVSDFASSGIKILLFVISVVISVIFIFYKEILKNGKK